MKNGAVISSTEEDPGPQIKSGDEGWSGGSQLSSVRGSSLGPLTPIRARDRFGVTFGTISRSPGVGGSVRSWDLRSQGESVDSLGRYSAGNLADASSPIKDPWREVNSSPISMSTRASARDESVESQTNVITYKSGTFKQIPSDVATRVCIFNTGPITVEEFKTKLIDRFGKAFMGRFLYLRLVAQPNGQHRFDVWIRNEVCALTLSNLKSLRSQLKWIVSFWRNWKDRNGFEPVKPKPKRCELGVKDAGRVRIGTYNVNGIAKKKEEIENFIDTEGLAILLVQETLLKPLDRALDVPGFVVFSKSAIRGGAGQRGQAILVRRDLTGYELDLKDPNLIGVRVIGIPGDDSWVVISVYLPSGGNFRGERGRIFKRVRRLMRRMVRAEPSVKILVGGDWNTEKVKVEKFLPKWKVPIGLLPTAGSDKTRRSKQGLQHWSSIDYFVVTQNAANELTSARVMRHWDLSDHFPVVTQVRLQGNKPSNQKVGRPTFARKGFDDKISSIVSHNRFAILADSAPENAEEVHEYARKFEEACLEVAKEHELVSDAIPEDVGQHKLPQRLKLAIAKRRKLYAKLLEQQLGTDAERIAKDEYLVCKKAVKRRLQKEREKFYKVQLAEGAELMRSNMSAAWWKWLDRQTNSKGRRINQVIPLRDHNGVLQLEEQAIAEVQARHYRTLGEDPSGLSGNLEYWETLMGDTIIGEPQTELYQAPIKWSEVVERLKKADGNKAVGQDRIPYEFLKLAKEGQDKDNDEKVPNNLGRALLNFVRGCVSQGVVPLTDRVGEVVSVPKSGDLSLMANYRGVTLLNHKNKLVNGVITDRISVDLKFRQMIAEEQAGFRMGEEAIGHVCALYEIVRRRSCHKPDEPTYLFFGDFKKAFDMVPHGAMIAKLKGMGVTNPVLKLLTESYEKGEAVVRAGSAFSDKYRLARGTKQGDVPSPIVFNVFINGLIAKVKATGVGVDVPGIMGLMALLLFADDALGLARTVEELRIIIGAFQAWVKEWGMEFGIPKCGVMMLNATEAQKEEFRKLKFKIGNECVPHVKEYKYLGVHVTEAFGNHESNRGDLAAFAKKRVKAVNEVLDKLRPFLRCKTVPLHLRVRCLMGKVIPVATYGGEWSGMRHETSDEIQAAVNRGIKWVLGSKSKNTICQPALMSIELGIPNIGVQMSAARARAYLKYSTKSETTIRRLCANPWYKRNEGRAWCHGTTHWMSSQLKDLDWKSSEVTGSEVLEAVRATVYSSLLNGLKKNKAYLSYEGMAFEKTREYLLGANWQPQLAPGVVWLSRLRCSSVWSRRARWDMALHRPDVDLPFPLADKEKCPKCNDLLQAAEREDLHVLVACQGYQLERKKLLGRYMPGLRDEAQRLLATRRNKSDCLVNLAGGLLLGGFKGSSRCRFTAAFGHDPKVVLESGEYSYGYIPVALFLAQVMPIHMGVLFDGSLDDRTEGYISVSQSDF